MVIEFMKNIIAAVRDTMLVFFSNETEKRRNGETGISLLLLVPKLYFGTQVGAKLGLRKQRRSKQSFEREYEPQGSKSSTSPFPHFPISPIQTIFAIVVSLVLLTGCQQQSDPQEAGPETPSAENSAPDTASETLSMQEKFSEKPVLKTGYVTALCLHLRSQPNANSEVIGFVFQGDRLTIYDTGETGGGNWYYASDAAGYMEGWISAAYVSNNPVASTYTHIEPDGYREARTPTVIEGINAKYLGVAACIECHNKPHAGFSLGPYGVWRDHFHSSAYETLKKSYTRAFAQKRGIADPLNDWRCQKCHVTALGVPAERLGPNYRDEDGVGCETCHGPGGDYLYKHYEENISKAELEAMGFRVFRNLEKRDTMCRSCHNELSPSYKPFNVLEFSKAIRHWGSEFTVTVVDPQQPPVIGEREPVAQKPPPSEEQIKALVSPPPNPAPTADQNSLLAGIAKEWILDRSGEKGQVYFPHLAHIVNNVRVEQEASVCLVCHHTTQAGVRPVNCSEGACHKFEPTQVSSREKAFHSLCRDCHRERNIGPQKCSQCHKPGTESSLTVGVGDLKPLRGSAP